LEAEFSLKKGHTVIFLAEWLCDHCTADFVWVKVSCLWCCKGYKLYILYLHTHINVFTHIHTYICISWFPHATPPTTHASTNEHITFCACQSVGL